MIEKENVIYLNRKTPIKVKPKSRVLVEELLRIATGFSIILGSMLIAYSCEESRASERKINFNQCLKTGKTPIFCSFEIAFKETK